MPLLNDTDEKRDSAAVPRHETAGTVLDVRNLSVSFQGEGRTVTAVDDVSFTVTRRRTLAIVGESGSGKSVTALAIMGLLPAHSARISGTVRFNDRDLLQLPKSALRSLRGNRMSMIFQEPMTSLNPSHTIGAQIDEVIREHRSVSRKEATERTLAMLRLVRIPSPETRYHQYPHNLSGGMRQRVMIAMALACDPELLIADEPTTALDVTIQAQVLDLMRDLQKETGAAIVLITHDLGVVAESADDVIVMYAGQVVEQCPVDRLLTMPAHPYSVGLLGSLPRLDARRERLVAITGSVPDMTDPPTGCRFRPRCPFSIDACAEPAPLREIADGHFSRCWRAPLETLVP